MGIKNIFSCSILTKQKNCVILKSQKVKTAKIIKPQEAIDMTSLYSSDVILSPLNEG